MRTPPARGLPLLSPAARRPAAAVTAACLAVLAVLGALVAGQTRADPFDRWAQARILDLLGGHPGLVAVTDLGNPQWLGPICLAAAAACAAARRYRAALLPLIAVPLASLLTERLLKPLIHRTNFGFLMFPSGHTTVVCAAAVCAVIVLTGPARPPLPPVLRRVACAAVLAIVPVVAVALVVAHYHLPTDTVGGAATGTAVALATALALDAAAARRSARRTAGVPAASRAPAEEHAGERAGISAPAAELPPV
jgi:membrane-associated phospholipid phosphatase